MARRPLVAGNWKMNGLSASVSEFVAVIDGAADRLGASVDVLVCPPAVLISAFAARAKGTPVAVGAQDCHPKASGPHTGDLSAEMLRDAGARAVIVGHSERRQDHRETDDLVRAKAEAAARAGLLAIVCVGELEAERKSQKTLAVVSSQLENSLPNAVPEAGLAVAYEPVWAIGSGLTPSPADVAEVHAMIRDNLRQRYRDRADPVRILYGGSVKPENAAALLRAPDVDGALVGGASLRAADFLAIARVYVAVA